MKLMQMVGKISAFLSLRSIAHVPDSVTSSKVMNKLHDSENFYKFGIIISCWRKILHHKDLKN